MSHLLDEASGFCASNNRIMKQIAFLTDVHLNEQFPIDNDVNPNKNLERVIKDIEERKISDIIFGGDIGEFTSHQYFFDALKPFALKLILGNHDKFEEVATYFNPNNETAELYYKIEDEHFEFIFLDSSADEVGEVQLEWLRSALPTSKEPIIFIHHPVVEIDTAIDKLYPLKNRDRVRSVLTEYGKNIILFCGHYHMNDESTFKNITQFTTQSLSFQIVKNAEKLEISNANFGYRIIKLDADKIETELVRFQAE